MSMSAEEAAELEQLREANRQLTVLLQMWHDAYEAEGTTSTRLADIAAAEGREYVTPEDITAAVAAGVPKLDIWGEALAILGKQRGLGVEDRSLFAFVAFEAGREAEGDDA